MPPLFPLSAELNAPHGPLPLGYQIVIPPGYSTLVGRNDEGKSAILQCMFLRAYDESKVGSSRICLIPADRSMFRPTLEIGDITLATHNDDLINHIRNGLLPYDQPRGRERSELAAVLLQHTNFHIQNDRINDLLMRLRFPPIIVKSGMKVFLEDLGGHLHGSGLRAVWPILAALTNDDLNLILVDEPEVGLEASLQRELKEIFIESATEERPIVVATHSHLFLDRDNPRSVFVVRRGDPAPDRLQSVQQLADTTFQLLGNSTEDLFFPGNFLVVEGASDQKIVEQVLALRGAKSGNVKVLAARGIGEVTPALTAIRRALIPLTENDSPYARTAVALVDSPPNDVDLNALRGQLGDRLVELPHPSLEEYLPEAVYVRAGLDKALVLRQIASAARDYKERSRIKAQVSDAVAAVLADLDLPLIPEIVQAADQALRARPSQAGGGVRSVGDE